MPKKLIVCTDGTWNPVESISAKVRTSTNVAKIAAIVAPISAKGQRQLVCYVEGVGTHEDDAISGGAFGWGLSANVEFAYRFLAQNYEPDDEIYLFGFSRGAFTARSLSGLLRNCGIVTARCQDKIDDAFRLYKDRRDETDADSIRAKVFRKQNSHEVEVKFLGVWDTVGALGLPCIRHQVAKALGWDWRFHDTSLGPHIRHACHALAIHENRGKFLPTLWIKDKRSPQEQRLEQMWFSGCHSNVGGGYKETTLSDITLEWMVERATFADLTFVDDWRTELEESGQGYNPDFKGSINTEFKGIYPYVDSLSSCPNGVYRQTGVHDQASRARIPRKGSASLLPKLISAVATIVRKLRKPSQGPVDTGLTFEDVHQSVRDRYAAKLQDDWWPPTVQAMLESSSGIRK